MSSPQSSHVNRTQSPSRLSPLEIAQNMVSNPDSPQPELATMTNVNVLDLQKDYSTDEKIYDKDHSVYVYSTNNKTTMTPPPTTSNSNECNKIDENEQMINPHILHHRHPSENSIIDGRLMVSAAEQHRNEQMLAKLTVTDEQILRLVSGANGDNQKIISREMVNGEHHVLTRNENGEHILTRIVTTSDHKLNLNDNIQYISAESPPTNIITNSPNENTVVYASADPTDQLTTSVLQYEGSKGSTGTAGNTQHMYITSGGGGVGVGSSVITSDSGSGGGSSHTNKNQKIVYAHSEKDYNDSKEESYDDSEKSEMFSGTSVDKIYEKPQMDLIYEDGNKTVIYTTSTGGDPKGLEIYSGSELGLLSDGQVIVQGGLQYTAQQMNGQTIFVLAESIDSDINGQLQR